MTHIQADAGTLLRQASDTADEYLGAAIKCIDQRLGKGYAAKNPDLIAAFMRVAGDDFRTSIACKIGESVLGEMASAVSSLAEAVRETKG
jgi:hypothetical protein